MAGAFQTSRDIFTSPIWKNIVEFRLFFLIYGSAVFSEEGYRVTDDLHLQRGQWLRSTRKLQEDLEYIENRQVKKYSTSVINRTIKSLIKSQRISVTTHELGTVFTALNYEEYQKLANYKLQDTCTTVADTLQEACTKTDQLGTPTNDDLAAIQKGNEGQVEPNLERNLEQCWNSVGTISEQHRNNNKKENKDKKVKKEDIKINYTEFVKLTTGEYEKLVAEYGEEMTKECIDILNTYKGSTGKKYKSDYMTLTPKAWVAKRYREDQEKKIRPFPIGGQRHAKYGTGHDGRSDAELNTAFTL